jgi:hypothetical protein
MMVRAWRFLHPDEDVNVEDFRRNSKDMRNLIAKVWCETYAEKFATFANNHPELLVDMNNPVDVDRVFEMFANEHLVNSNMPPHNESNESLGAREQRLGPLNL